MRALLDMKLAQNDSEEPVKSERLSTLFFFSSACKTGLSKLIIFTLIVTVAIAKTMVTSNKLCLLQVQLIDIPVFV